MYVEPLSSFSTNNEIKAIKDASVDVCVTMAQSKDSTATLQTPLTTVCVGASLQAFFFFKDKLETILRQEALFQTAGSISDHRSVDNNDGSK